MVVIVLLSEYAHADVKWSREATVNTSSLSLSLFTYQQKRLTFFPYIPYNTYITSEHTDIAAFELRCLRRCYDTAAAI